ncbi:MAG TPA: DUF3301 domain-containing protein [Accumulibacter sp.]|uniref:DUF3301 domain-containing protein n=1 Tax=Accumulibacter sp. TaxID=2053492 RepID=UPI002C9A98DE|nr:DUF3301 domain-containing protein [Accumulibacter sp.]HRD92880.1 DUF3301 domain-containing protein [Accumulibacter sp.]HRF71911.1 DUF3301 domain-containing protein [Accumulibacter sp.]
METLSLLGMLAAGWLWLDSFRAREAGIRAVRAACDADQLQLLDDTVALASLRPARDDEGRLRLRRVYRFEYSDTGDNRRNGQITLLGSELLLLHLPRVPGSALRLVASEGEPERRQFPRLPS